MTDGIKRKRRRKPLLKVYDVRIRSGKNVIRLNAYSKDEAIEKFQALTGHDLSRSTAGRSLITATLICVIKEGVNNELGKDNESL